MNSKKRWVPETLAWGPAPEAEVPDARGLPVFVTGFPAFLRPTAGLALNPAGSIFRFAQIRSFADRRR